MAPDSNFSSPIAPEGIQPASFAAQNEGVEVAPLDPAVAAEARAQLAQSAEAPGVGAAFASPDLSMDSAFTAQNEAAQTEEVQTPPLAMEGVNLSASSAPEIVNSSEPQTVEPLVQPSPEQVDSIPASEPIHLTPEVETDDASAEPLSVDAVSPEASATEEVEPLAEPVVPSTEQAVEPTTTPKFEIFTGTSEPEEVPTPKPELSEVAATEIIEPQMTAEEASPVVNQTELDRIGKSEQETAENLVSSYLQAKEDLKAAEAEANSEYAQKEKEIESSKKAELAAAKAVRDSKILGAKESFKQIQEAARDNLAQKKAELAELQAKVQESTEKIDKGLEALRAA